MKNVILLHGTCGKNEYENMDYPSASNSHWFPWLQKKLHVGQIPTATPDMLNSYMPHYENWKKEFKRYDITKETTLVGHSCGGGFLVRYLSEHPNIKVKNVILVAPWLDPENEKQNYFFDFTIDSTITNRSINGITLYVSKDDDKDIQDSVETIISTIPDIKKTDFSTHGHFTKRDMGTVEFPELYNDIMKHYE